MFMYCVSYVYVLCIMCLCIVYHMFMYCVSYVYVLCIICFSEDRKTVAEVLLFDETFHVETDSRNLKIVSDIQNRWQLWPHAKPSTQTLGDQVL